MTDMAKNNKALAAAVEEAKRDAKNFRAEANKYDRTDDRAERALQRAADAERWVQRVSK